MGAFESAYVSDRMHRLWRVCGYACVRVNALLRARYALVRFCQLLSFSRNNYPHNDRRRNRDRDARTLA